MMYHVVKCDDCGFTMTVPWNVAADQHAKAHGWFIYPPQARCPKCGMLLVVSPLVLFSLGLCLACAAAAEFLGWNDHV